MNGVSMNDFCIFDGPIITECSNLMWGLVDKMYSNTTTDSFTSEIKTEYDWYKKIISDKYPISLSAAGTLTVNLSSQTHPLINEQGTLELTENETSLPIVDNQGTLIL